MAHVDEAVSSIRQLVDALPVGAVISRDRRWVYVNAAFARSLGHPREALVGRAALDFLHPEDAEAETDPSSEERRFVANGGRVVTFEVTETMLADFEGQPAVLVMARDVTEHKKLLTERVLSERMVTVGTLVAGIAHEINNPLAYVTANLEVLAEEIRLLPAASPELAQIVSEAREGADRVRKIVRGLKLFSRADEERRSNVDLVHVLDVALNMTHNEIRHRARLVKDFGTVPAVVADEARLGQVFINLLINAAQAIPQGRPEQNEIRAVTRTENGAAVVEVRDTGSGIPTHARTRLFDPFFTTKPIGVGTGLGLAICHGIVTAAGGRIEVDTEVGRGSCFRVVLPPALNESAGRKAPSASRQPTRRARVLVVDDDVLLVKGMKRVLREHEVTTAHSGAEALEILRRESTFDVVLCDLMMSQMSGIELFTELASRPDLKSRFVFLTGGAFTPEAREFLDEVPNQRLEKPVEAQHLRAVVEQFASATA
jgi:two-component system, cell cycle sensor histidine kinase and response regulator CckA